MFLKNKNIIFRIRRSKVTDYAALTVLLECKTEERKSQCEHGQPMKQTRGLFCT